MAQPYSGPALAPGKYIATIGCLGKGSLWTLGGLIALAAGLPAHALSLYDGNAGVPTSQGELVIGALGSSPNALDTVVFLVSGGETQLPNGVRIDTDSMVVSGPAEYVGYSNYNPLSDSFLGSSEPIIKAKQFTLSFTVNLIDYADPPSAPLNRAAFSVLVVGEGNKAIELGWGIDGRIFSQSDGNPGFSRAEVSTDSSYLGVTRTYELVVAGGLLPPCGKRYLCGDRGRPFANVQL